MPSPSTSSFDKSYDIIELESGDLELHEVQKPQQALSPTPQLMEITTELPSVEVDKEKMELVVEIAVQAEEVKDFDTSIQETIKDTAQELQGKLVKSPVKDVKATQEIELEKSPPRDTLKGKEIEKEQPPPTAATIEVVAQQPQEWTSDHGSEFTSHQFVDYCAEFGIHRELSNVGTPLENGVVERKNRTVVEMGRTMLEHRDLPRYLWAPRFVVPQATPYEVYFGQKPSITHLHIFGCDAYAHIPKKDRSKFDAKSRKLIHVGYNSVSSSFHLYDPALQKIEHSRDVIFNESSILDRAHGLSSKGASPHVSLVPDEPDC
ncbi:hypothetical protein L7F22_027902 [Adiantum nelumboides]|nr:hypothetical protein [Adiantum nelumboides]